MAVVEPIQNLVIDDLIAQLAKVTTAAGKSSLLGTDDVAIVLLPREPKSLQDEPVSHGETIVYDASDGPGDGEAVQTQVRDFTVMVEIYAVQSTAAATNVRRLLRRAWGQAVQVVCDAFGQRAAGVNKIEAGDVVIVPDEDGNGARAFCEFNVTLEHLANDPTAAR